MTSGPTRYLAYVGEISHPCGSGPTPGAAIDAAIREVVEHGGIGPGQHQWATEAAARAVTLTEEDRQPTTIEGSTHGTV